VFFIEGSGGLPALDLAIPAECDKFRGTLSFVHNAVDLRDEAPQSCALPAAPQNKLITPQNSVTLPLVACATNCANQVPGDYSSVGQIKCGSGGV
jgi:hypothetical protein